MSEAAASAGHLVVVGANHRSGSMSFRDRLFVEDMALPAFLDGLPGLSEAMVLSTGERVDVIAIAPDAGSGIDVIIDGLARHAGLPADDVRAQTYGLRDADACRHVFRVAASLDSLMVGERQIGEQLCDALDAARDAGSDVTRLSVLVDAASKTAEQVFKDTELGGMPISISSVARQVAHDLHGDLARCSGLLIGGGDTSELIVEDLLAAGLARLSVAHPNPTRAEATARALHAHSVAMDAIADAIVDADIVLSALGKTGVTLSVDMVREAIKARRYRPIFIIDAGIPGDVDAGVDALEEAFVYTLDDLERVAMTHRVGKKGDAEDAARMVDAAASAFAARDGDDLERARVAALAEAGGDADTATRLLLDKVKALLGKKPT